VEEADAEEHFSILHNIVTFNFFAYYLSQHLAITEMFAVGGKITEVL
jgi:glucosamine--fructose-6-phosphate aminotransferase (isomerizing)